MKKLKYWLDYIMPYKIQKTYEYVFYKWQKVLAFYYRGKNKNTIPHWFQYEYTECVLCGQEDGFRNYMYGKKPKNGCVYFIRHEGACESHF